MNIFSILILLLTSSPLWALSSYHPSSETIGARNFELQVSGELFSSHSKYDDNGNKQDFSAGAGFKRLQSEVRAILGLGENFDFSLGFLARYNHSIEPPNDIENSGLESYFGAIKYQLGEIKDVFGYHLKTAFILEARNTAYDTDKYSSGSAPTDTIVLGDDGFQLKTGLNITLAHKHDSFLATQIHYVIPPNDLAHEVQYSAEFAQRLDTTAIIAGLRGVISIENGDERSDMSTGSTNLYNSLNRNLTMPYVGFNIASTNFRIELEAGYIVTGRSTDQGYQLKTNICWGI